MVAFAAGGLMLPSARGQVPEGTVSQALASVQLMGMASINRMEQCKRECDDCFFQLFPGVVAQCVGLRRWHHGHYRSGLVHLKLAAGWGSKHAEYALGLIYYNGHHVAADRALGIAWLTLANQRHNNPQFALADRSAIKAASVAQRQRAQQLLVYMRKRYGRAAAERAWLRLYRNHVGQGFYANTSCVLQSGEMVPWRPELAGNPKAICVQSNDYSQGLAKAVEIWFKGMSGSVTVGPLQPVPASAASIGGR